MSKKIGVSQGTQDEVRELAKALFIQEVGKQSLRQFKRDWLFNECYSLARSFCEFDQEDYLAKLALEQEEQERLEAKKVA